MQMRPAAPEDSQAIRVLALENEMFLEDEMDGFDEMLGAFFDGRMEGHFWIVALEGLGEILGAAYYAPEPFSDRMWNLYFLAVKAGSGRTGVGSELINEVERLLTVQGEQVARTLIVETSSLDKYAQSRSFYVKSGYVQEATIREFYGPGDDKVVFWKALSQH